MSWLDQLPEYIEELKRAGRLQQNGRSAEALPIIDRVLASATDPTTRAYALVQRFGALINLGRIAELSTAMTATAPASAGPRGVRTKGREGCSSSGSTA